MLLDLRPYLEVLPVLNELNRRACTVDIGLGEEDGEASYYIRSNG